MPTRSRLLPASLLLSLAACSSGPKGALAPTQTIVEKLAAETAGLQRLSVHGMDGDGQVTVLASTDGTRLGQPSDREDLTAMQTGKPVVLEEVGACDITIPVLEQDGRWTHAVGVTLLAAPGKDRKPLIGKAIAIAGEVAKHLDRR